MEVVICGAVVMEVVGCGTISLGKSKWHIILGSELRWLSSSRSTSGSITPAIVNNASVSNGSCQ